jgi:YHS domain-containing protein
MFRNLFRILLVLLAVVFVRYVFMTIGRAVRSPHPSKSKGPENAKKPARSGDESKGLLRKDPQCGTYVSESSSVTLKVGGESLYFCSIACRDEYAKQTQHS